MEMATPLCKIGNAVPFARENPTVFRLAKFDYVSGCFCLGLGFCPKDYQQGDSYRIIFIHVPAAIWSMGVYGSMAVAGLVALVWQIRQANLAMISMAPIGLVFAFISLATGAIWGKPMWGLGGCGTLV